MAGGADAENFSEEKKVIFELLLSFEVKYYGASLLDLIISLLRVIKHSHCDGSA